MGDLNKKFTEYDFTVKLVENGWIVDLDQQIVLFTELYNLVGKSDKYPALEAILNLMTNTSGWEKKDRDGLFAQLDNVINQYIKDGSLTKEDVPNYFKKKDSIVTYGKTELAVLMSKTKNKLKELKKQEDARTYKEYMKKVPGNRENFDKKYNISRREFVDKMRDYGWVIGSDDRVFEGIFNICRNSASPTMLELFDKLLVTPINNIDERNKMISQIKKAKNKASKNEEVRGTDYVDLNSISSNLNVGITQEYFDRLLVEHRTKKRVNGEVKIFKNTLRDNGWDDNSIDELSNMYKSLADSEIRYNYPLTENMSIFTSKKLDENNKATDIYNLIDKFIAQTKKHQDEPSFDNRYKYNLARIKDSYEKLYSKEQFNALGNEFKQENKPKEQKMLKEAEDVLTKRKTAKQSEKTLTEALTLADKKDNKKGNLDESKSNNLVDNIFKTAAKKKEMAETDKTALDVMNKDKMIKHARDMYKMIKDVDFNLLGQGSEQFRDMLLTLKNWKEFTEENFRNNITLGNLAKYLDMQKNCIDYVRSYVDYKRDQLDGHPERVNDRKRQAHEQPRVSAALSVLEKMEQAYAYGEYGLVNTVRQNFRTKLTNALKEEAKVLSSGEYLSEEDIFRINYEAKGDNKKSEDMKKLTTRKNYLRTVAKAADMVYVLNGEFWSPINNENFERFVNRIGGLVDMDKYEDENRVDTELVKAKHHYNRNILKKADVLSEGGKFGEVEYEGGKKYTDISPIKTHVKSEYKRNTGKDYVIEKNIKQFNPKQKSTDVTNEVTNLRSTMISNAQKAKEEAARVAAANKAARQNGNRNPGAAPRA